MFMWRAGGAALLLVLGSFSSSPSYKLNNYSLGGASTNSAASNTYKAQGSLGEQSNNATTGTTDTAKNASIQAEQLNVPGAPTLSDGGGTYYNQLNCIITTSSNPTDSTYAIAVSTDNFVTDTRYVQANGTLGSTPVFQSYTTWGGASGFQIIGLTASTTYEAKVSAMQGMFTNTIYGAAATKATVAPTLSFSVSPASYSIGHMLPNTVVASSNLSLAYATNSVSGGNVFVIGKNAGFYSSTKSYTIPAYSGDLSAQPQGIGLQVSATSQTSGGPFSSVSPFNGTGSSVGGASSSGYSQMLTDVGPVSGGSATANVQVKASYSAPPASDYGETFTFVAAASF